MPPEVEREQTTRTTTSEIANDRPGSSLDPENATTSCEGKPDYKDGRFHEVISIDGVMHWGTASQPGSPIGEGGFEFEVTASNQMYLRYVSDPKEQKIEDTGDVTAYSDWAADPDNDQYRQERAHMAVLGWKRSDTYVAFDISGRIDVDAHNPGPELDPHGQLTAVGKLLIEDQQALAHFKERERQSILASAGGVTLDEEEVERHRKLNSLRRSSRSSSLSDISATHDEDVSKLSPCGDTCWLRSCTSTQLAAERVSHSIVVATAAVAVYSDNDLMPYQQIGPDETRILRLLPGSAEEPITCQLLTMAIPGIDNKEEGSNLYSGRYTALSYTWGASERTHTVTCNDKPMLVTANVFSALANFREVDNELYLWIDAICIDQNNLAERNAQVRRMMEIYKGASLVIIWLGESTEDTDFAISAMEYLDNKEHRVPVMQRTHGTECLGHLCDLLRAQITIFERPWFLRSWVRQEVGVSRKLSVVCGQRHFSWSLLKRSAKRLVKIRSKLKAEATSLEIPQIPAPPTLALRFLKADWIFGEPLVTGVGEIRSIWFYHAGGLLDLLMGGREFQATDPRDKIYSVLGLGRVDIEATATTKQPGTTASETESGNHVMVIDYSKSVSEVYQSLAKYVINRDQNLDILCVACIHRDKNSHDLPTWAPDWRVTNTSIDAQKDYFELKYAAAGFTTTIPQSQHELNTLKVQGYIVDFVTEILDTTCRAVDLLNSFFGNAHNSGIRPFNEAVDPSRSCNTIAGRTALVPATAEAGNKIMVLLGSRIPFVMRECADQEFYVHRDGSPYFNDLKWKIIGPCCVPDLMYGSVMKRIQTVTTDVDLLDVTIL